MKTCFLSLLFILFCSVAFTQNLIPFEENGKWGFKDTEQKMVIDPVYDQVNVFSYSYAVVWKNNRAGFIDEKGKVIIPIEFNDAAHYSGSLFLVQKNEKWGYLDKTGKNKTGFVFDKAFPFYSSTTANVSINGKWGCIDKNGKVIIPLEYEDIGYLGDGLIHVMKNGKWGYVDNQNKIKIPFNYSSASGFTDGMAWVSVDSLYGMINISGQWVIPAEFENVEFEYMNWIKMIAVRKDGKIGFYNTQGIKLTDCIYTRYEEYLWDHVMVRRESEYLGLITKTGEEILAPVYREILSNESGIFIVMLDTVWGIYDIESKKMTVTPRYDQINDPEGDVCFIVHQGKQGLYSIPLKRIIIEPAYTGLEFHSQGFYLSFLDGKVGLINKEGKVILGNKYSYIDIRNKKTIVAVGEDEVYEYYTLDGKRIEKK